MEAVRVQEACESQFRRMSPVSRTYAATTLDVAFALLCFLTGFTVTQHLFNQTFAYDTLTHQQQQLIFYSEQAWYLSFFRRVVESPSLSTAFAHLLRDNITEYPESISSLTRFNIWPEVAAGVLSRASGSTQFNINFILTFVWCSSGLLLASVYACGRAISSSSVGGLVAAGAFLANLNIVTRVHSNAMLRETFALPFLWIQVAGVIVLLRSETATKQQSAGWKRAHLFFAQLAICCCTCIFTACWQFAVLAVLVQLGALYGAFCLFQIDLAQLASCIRSILIGLFATSLLFLGNDMQSPSLSLLVALALQLASVYLLPHVDTLSPSKRFLTRVVVGVSALVAALLLKFFISHMRGNADDQHVLALLKSFFSDFE